MHYRNTWRVVTVVLGTMVLGTVVAAWGQMSPEEAGRLLEQQERRGRPAADVQPANNHNLNTPPFGTRGYTTP